jgi:hypothetical protein
VLGFERLQAEDGLLELLANAVHLGLAALCAAASVMRYTTRWRPTDRASIFEMLQVLWRLGGDLLLKLCQSLALLVHGRSDLTTELLLHASVSLDET